jgi:capsular polysaccharide biosynthesis protein
VTYYLQIVRSRWPVVLLFVLVGLVAAGGYLYMVPKEYTATATVSVNVISSDPFNASRAASGLLDTAGEAQVAGSYAVAQRAAEELGPGFTPEGIRGSVSVASMADTTILRISSTSESAADARLMADTVAAEYLEFRSTQADTRIQGTLDRSEARLDGLRQELAAVTARMAAAADGSAEALQADADQSVLSLEISSVLSEMASVGSIDTMGGNILNPAAGNNVLVKPRPSMTLASGGLVGLGLGLAAAFVVNAAASRVRDVRDVTQSGGGTVLAELAEKHPAIPPSPGDVTHLRAARERILADPALASRTGVCAVIDVTPDGRAGDVALNLAYVIAASGVAVEFVGLGMSQDLIEQAREQLGLTASRSADSAFYSSARNDHLSCYLPAADEQESTEEPVPARVRQELAARAQEALVIVGVPATAAEATRLAACRLADCAVLVASRGATRARSLHQTAQDVHHMGGYVLGTLVVSRDRTGALTERRKGHLGRGKRR